MLEKITDWLGHKLGIVILAPHPIAIGNCAEQIYFGFLKARRERKKLLILFQYPLPRPFSIRLTNRKLFSLESEHLYASDRSLTYVAGSSLVTIYGMICRLLRRPFRVLGFPLSDIDTLPMLGHTSLWQPEALVKEFTWDVVRHYAWPAQLREFLPVTLSTSCKAEARALLSQYGLPDGAWFACLHVRESGFHGDEINERNATIANYSLLIREITSRGGWVIRMGDKSMTPLPKMEHVIDYPFTSLKSELMDIHLISACRVYIGMTSGIFDVARLFQRPIILTNMASWLFAYPQLPGDMGIFKHVFSKSQNRFLSIREWMEVGWEGVSFVEAMRGDYVLHENTPEELRSVMVEFFERNGNSSALPIQQKFLEMRLEKGRELLSGKIIEGDEFSDIHQRYRLASRFESAVGLIGNDYLESNLEVCAMLSEESGQSFSRGRLPSEA